MPEKAACVAVRSADDELARRVHVELHVVAEEFLHAGRQLLLHPWDEDVANVGLDFFDHAYIGFVLGFLAIVGGFDEVVMLCADDYGVDAEGIPAFAVFHRHLRLGIGTEVGHLLAFAADLGQLQEQHVGEVDGEWHVVLGLLAGEAEHHALVAGTLVLRFFATHTHVNVVRLSVQGRQDATRLCVELVLRLVVADAVDDAAGHVLDLDVGVGADFAGNDDQTGSD